MAEAVAPSLRSFFLLGVGLWLMDPERGTLGLSTLAVVAAEVGVEVEAIGG